MSIESTDFIAGVIASGVLTTMMFLAVGVYIINALTYYKIAEKAGLGNAWIAFIPILQFIIMFHVIDKSAWWIILYFIPFVNIIATIVFTYQFMDRFDIPGVVIILAFIIPFLMAGVFLYMAFSGNCHYRGHNRYQAKY